MTDTTHKGAVHLTAADFAQTVKQSGLPVMVDFYADWCGPCKLAAPIIDKLADEYDGKVIIAKMDTDTEGEIARQYGVMSIPTVIVFKQDGEEIKELDRKIGFGGEAGYRQMLQKLVPPTEAAA